MSLVECVKEERDSDNDLKQEPGSEQAEDPSEVCLTVNEGDGHGVSMQSVHAGFYLHTKTEVKEELEIGPEYLQPPDYAYLLAASSSRVPECSVRLERLPGLGHAPARTKVEQPGSTDTPSEDKRSKKRTKKKRYYCDVCSKPFQEKKHFVHHIKKRMGDGQHFCEVWMKLFKRNTTLTCAICMQRFTDKSDLVNHIKNHSEDKLPTCEICMQSFKRKSDLIIHKRLHTGEKLFTCDYCKKRYAQKSSLANHISLHMKTESYTCKLCKKSFPDKSNMFVVKRMHPEDKYACELCLKKIKQENNLNNQESPHRGYVRFEVGGKPCIDTQKLIFLTPIFYKGM